jgi:hypothetical protein
LTYGKKYSIILPIKTFKVVILGEKTNERNERFTFRAGACPQSKAAEAC